MGSVAPTADVFRAVADPTRRGILDLLGSAERSATDLAAPFRMTRPAVSQHLRVLREAGLVRERRAGRQRLYRIEAAPLQAAYAWVARHCLVTDPTGHVWGWRRDPSCRRTQSHNPRPR